MSCNSVRVAQDLEQRGLWYIRVMGSGNSRMQVELYFAGGVGHNRRIGSTAMPSGFGARTVTEGEPAAVATVALPGPNGDNNPVVVVGHAGYHARKNADQLQVFIIFLDFLLIPRAHARLNRLVEIE